MICCSGAVPIVSTAEVEATRGGEDGGLVFYFGVMRGICVEDGLENTQELAVLGEVRGCGREGGCGSDCE